MRDFLFIFRNGPKMAGGFAKVSFAASMRNWRDLRLLSEIFGVNHDATSVIIRLEKCPINSNQSTNLQSKSSSKLQSILSNQFAASHNQSESQIYSSNLKKSAVLQKRYAAAVAATTRWLERR